MPTISEEEWRRRCLTNPEACVGQNRNAAFADEVISGMGLPGSPTSFTRRDLERGAAHMLKFFALARKED